MSSFAARSSLIFDRSHERTPCGFVVRHAPRVKSGLHFAHLHYAFFFGQPRALAPPGLPRRGGETSGFPHTPKQLRG